MSVALNQPQAAVFVGPGQPFLFQSFDRPTLSEGEALVQIDCCTLCGSDLHTIGGKRPVSAPLILGHEIIGRLVETTDGLCAIDGTPLHQGDRVSWAIAASCDDCFFCRAGLPQKCVRLFKYGHQGIASATPLSGGLATHCHLVSGTHLVKVPETVPDRVACPANCATATVAAALRVAGNCAGKTVAVFGAGMLGLTAAALLRSLGASHVVVVDINPRRAERATEFGATSTDFREIHPLTENRGCDLALDMSGSNAAIQQALSSLRIGGRLILVGSVFPTEDLKVQPEDLVRRMIRIEGVHNYTPADLQFAIDFLKTEQNQFPFESLVAREYTLQDLQQAIRDAVDDRPIRVAIRPS